MIVAEVMTSNPEKVNADTPVNEVIERMIDLDIRHLPVVEDGELVGIVSDRDLRDAGAAAENGGNVAARWAEENDMMGRVGDIMSSGVLTVDPESDLGSVIDIFLETKVGAIPVVDPDDGRLVGIVSYMDILRAAKEFM